MVFFLFYTQAYLFHTVKTLSFRAIAGLMALGMALLCTGLIFLFRKLMPQERLDEAEEI